MAKYALRNPSCAIAYSKEYIYHSLKTTSLVHSAQFVCINVLLVMDGWLGRWLEDGGGAAGKEREVRNLKVETSVKKGAGQGCYAAILCFGGGGASINLGDLGERGSTSECLRQQ